MERPATDTYGTSDDAKVNRVEASSYFGSRLGPLGNGKFTGPQSHSYAMAITINEHRMQVATAVDCAAMRPFCPAGAAANSR